MRARLKVHCRRLLSTVSRQNRLVLRIPEADVYRYGDAPPAKPLFRRLKWTIEEDETWGVVGTAGSGKNDLIQVLLGHHRIAPPPPGGVFPFLLSLDPPRDAYMAISHVSFATRPKSLGGGFYDYSARYGAVREEDKLTLSESLLAEMASLASKQDAETRLKRLAGILELEKLLDLPLIALSNGQTRRASVLRKLLTDPEFLILDEPLTGLDPHHRSNLMALLHGLQRRRKPRILLALRPQDPLPDWVSHVALVSDGRLVTGSRSEMNDALIKLRALEVERKDAIHSRRLPSAQEAGQELVVMKDVNVGYHGREVLKGINWTICENERWHLQGPNGSGKTTLLSLLTGDHPQSYIQRHLHLFGKPRRAHATLSLQRHIGFVSPELYNAFPRRLGEGALTARDAISTGFECTFSYRPRTAQQEERIDELLRDLAPESWSKDEKIMTGAFASLQPGEQALCLLLRALVNKPPLLILDEVFAGMDDAIVDKARKYLRENLEKYQAVIFISHWEEEVPWGPMEVKRVRLVNGHATFM